jgi:diacylglycerol kinase (ATP)
MRAIVIHNPAAGMRTDYAALDQALDALRGWGWRVELAETRSSGQATQFAQQAARDNYDAALAVGGDGTLNEVLNGLLDSETALGVLPYGTANVWAKEMGLPLNLVGAAQHYRDASTRCIDVGAARGVGFGPRAFVLWCSAGFDAQITSDIEQQRALKRRMGAFLFWLVGARTAFTFRGKRALITVDGTSRRRRVLMAVASNAQLYGGLVRLSPDARVDDGQLDLATFLGTGALTTAWHLVRVFLRLHLRAPDVIHQRGKNITIRARGLPVQVDGEPVGTTPVEISIRPRALRVLVPPRANRALFSDTTKDDRPRLPSSVVRPSSD